MSTSRDLHQPIEEEAEFWFDADGPSTYCEPTCTDRTCPGHAVKVQVCRECGYEHDGETPKFRPWPCPTIRGLDEMDAENERLRAALRAAAPTIRAVGDRTVRRLCSEAMPEEFGQHRAGLRAKPADLREREHALQIECQDVVSAVWRPVFDRYWDDCVIEVSWRWITAGAAGGRDVI